MFGLYLQNLEGERHSEPSIEVIKRCIKAGYLLGIALKALSSRSEKYHFPTSRVMTFYQGCIFSHDYLNITPNFDNEEDGNNFFSNLILGIREPLDQALRTSSLEYL